MITKKCPKCGKEFNLNYSDQRYCSKYCSIRYIRNDNHKKLMSSIKKGIPKSEETKSKIRMKLIGIKQGPNPKKSRKGILNGMYGKKRTDLSERNKNNPLKGERNPAWLGGISNLPYGWEFNKKLKLKIKQRDNFTCQLCNQSKFDGKRNYLTIHHIDYNKQNNSENNLITLCNYCNISVNTSREQWMIFFNKKLQEVNHHG